MNHAKAIYLNFYTIISQIRSYYYFFNNSIAGNLKARSDLKNPFVCSHKKTANLNYRNTGNFQIF